MKKLTRTIVMLTVAALAFAATAQALVITEFSHNNTSIPKDKKWESWYSQVARDNWVTFDAALNASKQLLPLPKSNPLVISDPRYLGTVNTTVTTNAGFVYTTYKAWEDTVGPASTTTFTFDTPQTTFGGWWDLAPGGYGGNLAISLIINGVPTKVGEIKQDGSPANPSDYWFWTSDTAFSGVLITALSGTETFWLQDMEYGIAVPEPSTFALLGVGLGCSMLWLRRKQN